MFPSASLRRSWPYYWGPLTGRLVVRSDDGYSSHRPLSRGQTGLHFHISTNGVFSTLPSSYFPTEALERRLGLTRLPSHGIDLLPPPLTSPTFEHFLSTQPEWSRRLLPTIVHDFSFGEIFRLFICPSTSVIAAATVQCNLFRERWDGCLPRATPVTILSNTVVWYMALVWTPTVQKRIAYYPSLLSYIFWDYITKSHYHPQSFGVVTWQLSRNKKYIPKASRVP
jgi:hypothetical protein